MIYGYMTPRGNDLHGNHVKTHNSFGITMAVVKSPDPTHVARHRKAAR